MLRPLLCAFGLSGLVAGCGRPALPDPRAAARAYSDAAARGDAGRIYALMTRESRRTYGEQRTRLLVSEERAELARQADALRRPDTRVDGAATVLLADGTSVELALEPQGFRVAAADTLPAAARTPKEALSALGRALSRRSYARPHARAQLGGARRARARRSLCSPKRSKIRETLDVRVEGDHADVALGSGHLVSLRRIQGTWHVEDVR